MNGRPNRENCSVSKTYHQNGWVPSLPKLPPQNGEFPTQNRELDARIRAKLRASRETRIFLVWRFYELLRNNEMAYGSQQESPRGCSSMVWGSLGGIPSNSSSSRPSVSPSFISHTLLYKTIRTETVSLSLIFSGSPSFRLPTVFRHHGQYQGMQQSRGIQELSTLL